MLRLKVSVTAANKDKAVSGGINRFFNYDYYRFFGRCIPGE